ncbi:SAM-dependent methyltransferase [Dactylosporangium sp. AC04546]|uniref:SAM-dependent methyltransferase n=1 Tax=Dactylosporangium sp. AC04546 TaxID=2862460 RepID=UPI001EE04D4F|nr:SAM-dependent methyltransferase [Dactylosporangium sp. AC04546]WVK80270.1 SAM-dependent methyltransferase [Dactylosporangium sp. AC04546]
MTGSGRIDSNIPNVARMYDYYLGGYHNFAVDREAAEKVLAIFPDTPAAARTNRRFLQRAVRYLAEEAGIRQFLDIGAGLPTQGNVHEVAPAGCKVVYVDNDPVAVAQARTLVEDLPDVSVALADLRDPDGLLADPHVCGHLDLTEPVAILMVSLLHFVPDDAKPGRLIAQLRDATAPGSHLVVSHLTLDGVAEAPARQGQEVYRSSTAPIVPRTRTDILRLFEGYDLVEPGLVWLGEWRPDAPGGPEEVSHGYGGVGMRPKY